MVAPARRLTYRTPAWQVSTCVHAFPSLTSIGAWTDEQAKMEAAVTMNSTDAVVSMVSKVAFATVCSVIER